MGVVERDRRRHERGGESSLTLSGRRFAACVRLTPLGEREMTDKIPMTRPGYDKLVKELEYLKTTKRREIAVDIAKARAFGDLKENAEYDAAKNSQAMNAKRVADIEDKLSRVQIIDESKIAGDQVFIGATVRLKDLKNEEEFSYTIVTQDEANFDEGKLSVTSPIAKGLLGLKEGDAAEIKIPAGTLKYKVLKITR